MTTTVQQLSLFMDPPAPAPDALALRPYQHDAIAALEGYWGSGRRRALINLPTGTGKTVLFAAVLRRNLGGRRGLVVAHREELLDQAAATIARDSGLSVGIEQADRQAGGVDVVVASVQTLVASGGRRLGQLTRNSIGLVVIDEAHHVSARTYIEVLHHFGLAPDPERFFAQGGRRAAIDGFEPATDAPRLLGVTATPSRTDKVGLEVAFDEIVYSRTIRDMISEGWLCPVRGVRVATSTSLDGVPTTHGDFAERALETTVNNDARNDLIIAAYHDHAQGRQAIVFAAGVAHAEALAAAFRAAGVSADWVSGAHDKDERRGAIGAYRRGELRVLANCAVLTEGFDAPETACVIMARPTKSSTLYTQCLGRGTRLANGKTDLVVIDVVDAYERAGLASAAALFGLPPKFAVAEAEDVPLDQLAMRFDRELEEYRVPSSLLGDATSWDDIRRIAQEVDPLQVAALDPVLRAVAKAAWLTAPWGYHLGLPEGSLGIVVDLLGQATVRFKARGEQPETLERFPDAEQAVRWAEHWLGVEHADSARLVERGARWRKDPPSERQLELARKLRILLPEGATRGHVSALIDQRLAKRR